MSPLASHRPRPQGSGLAVLALLFNAFCFGVSWWPFRQIAGLGLHPLWLTGISYGGVVALLLLARPGALLELARTPSLWALVLAAGLTNACFNWAVSFGDVVRVVLLFYLMPLWTVFWSRGLLGERISLRGAVRVALALAGAVVVLWPADAAVALRPADAAVALRPADAAAGAWPLPRNLAEWLGLLGGVSFALNNVLLRREARRSQVARSLSMFLGGALVALVLAGWLTWQGLAAPPPALAWPWALAASGLALWFLAANLALQFAAATLPANTTAVILITEVVFATVSALWLGAGSLGPREALGALMIFGAALLAAVQRD